MLTSQASCRRPRTRDRNPMMQSIDSLAVLADQFDAIVFDQWGVLHNGTAPYPGAVLAVEQLAARGKQLAVLSNSGKRAAPNRERIASLGLPADHFAEMMTSGEAFWQDCACGRRTVGRLFPITAKDGDAQRWGEGLSIKWAQSIGDADTMLLMGLPEGADGTAQRAQLAQAQARNLPLICTNPDRGSPRADGNIQLSPGALAHDYQDAGGKVTFYGKPHRPIFDALASVLGSPPNRTLMVGDSLEHDIAGGHEAGWKTVFVMSGLHADAFANGNPEATTQALARKHNAPLPDFLISQLAG